MDATAASGRLLIRSTVSHTLQAVGRTAHVCSVEAIIDGSLSESTGADLDTAVVDVAASLSTPELLEARAVFVPDTPQSIDPLRVGLSAFVADLGRFDVRFQPIVDLGSRQTVAVEALLRAADVGHLLDIVAHYRSQGSRIALDDVVAGFGSLNLVAQVAPDVVKIDRQLVQVLPNAEQATIATDLGVDLGQGWHIGYPERATDQAAVSSAAR